MELRLGAFGPAEGMTVQGPDGDTSREPKPREWLIVGIARSVVIAMLLTGMWMAIIHEVGRVLG